MYDPEAEVDPKGQSTKGAIDQKADTLGRGRERGPLPPPDLD